VQRCQVHKTRNILEYLSDRDRPWAQAILRRAYQATEVKTAQRLLLDLARRLETEYPSAAESVREGLEETLTVLTLKLSPRLRRSLATTNAVESLMSRTRWVKRKRQTLARGTDDASLDGRRHPRSREGFPSSEGIC
jgi:putative transposase